MIKLFEYTSDHSFRYFQNSNILRVYFDGKEVGSCVPSLPLFAQPIYDLTSDELSDMGIEATDNEDILIVRV